MFITKTIHSDVGFIELSAHKNHKEGGWHLISLSTHETYKGENAFLWDNEDFLFRELLPALIRIKNSKERGRKKELAEATDRCIEWKDLKEVIKMLKKGKRMFYKSLTQDLSDEL